jgi:type II secretory pathway pseudopilin PulG
VRRSFYLAEVAIVLAIVGLLTSVVVYSTIRQINRGRARGVVVDLENLAQASLLFYYANNGTWPAGGIPALQPQYIPAGFNPINCFGQPYWLNFACNVPPCRGVRAVTDVSPGSVTPDMAKNLVIWPGAGTGGTDRVEVFVSVNFGAATNAAWEKKNIY